jgi:DNA-binding SARP family transcriptional activator/tetratricopeptide (TPR) repeat protein
MRGAEDRMPGSGSEDVRGVSPGAASPGFEVRVLGPVEICWDGAAIDIGGLKSRALVARLLIDRNLVVSVDRLVDSLWGDNDGDGAEIALRSTISRLRKRLREAGATDDLIVTRAPGYMLRAPADVTDVYRFEQLLSEGRRQLARGRPSQCTRLLRQAEQIWRGPAYSEVRDEPFARAEARRLEEQLLSAIETRIDAGLTMGSQQVLVGELETLTHANPMRERLWSQRMLALYRCGRQADALRVFRDLRTILVDELGIEPGHDVAWMEQAILAQNPVLDYPVPPERPEAAPVAVPDEDPAGAEPPVLVPTGVGEGPLVGREHESEALASWWTNARRSYARLLLVDGDSGIGKTRLVAELARRAESDGAIVLWGRCDEETIVPFQPFAEALSRYFHSMTADRISRMPEWQLSELSRLVVRLREYAPEIEDDISDPESDRFRFFEAVTATLKDIAGRAPILIVLDDLHWADQPTVLLLRHVLRNFDRDNLGIVGMCIDTEVPPDHRLRSVLADLRADRRLDTVHLRGLSREAVEELMRVSTAPAGLAPELYVLTDGNPLFLDEMIRQLSYRNAAASDADTPVPTDLSPTEAIRELVARRVSRQPEDVIYLLQAAAVAGRECEAAVVAEAAELDRDRGLDAFDRAEESRLLRRVGAAADRYAFTHALVRDAIYDELLRGRRVRYHHKIAVATERLHGAGADDYVNELAHHFYMGAPIADADKALGYCMAAGERSLRLLAFEEAVQHFKRGLEVTEQYGDQDQSARCDALIALAEAQNRAGDTARANTNFERAAALARERGDAERLATAALRALRPLSYMVNVGTNAEQVRLLEEARSMLPDADSHLRALVSARLGLVMVYAAGVPGPGVRKRVLALNTEAVSMARRLGDRSALGYALQARMHALWGLERAPERLATGTELEEIATDVGDDMLAMHGHMWRVRELLAQGDVDAVDDENRRFAAAHGTGPAHPLPLSYSYNVEAMLALVNGDFEKADRLGPRAMEAAAEYNEMTFSFYGALMVWTWWQRGELAVLGNVLRDVIAQAPWDYPVARAALALVHAEAGEREAALRELDALAELGWSTVADDQTEGISLALTAAACGGIGPLAADHASHVYECLRPYAGTAVVIRPPAAACVGPADQYLGLLATAIDDFALAEVHFEAALRLAKRMRSAPFVAAAELELALVLRHRGRGEDERVAVLLRNAEEAAVRMGLRRMAARAANPD